MQIDNFNQITEEIYEIKSKDQVDPEAIFLHCGIVPIQHTPSTQIENLVYDAEETIMQVKECFSHSKIIISEVVPVQ